MHVMIDIETLGTAPGSAITQIAAVRFDDEKVYEPWSIYVSIDEQCSRGASIDIDTTRWWSERPEEFKRQINKLTANGVKYSLGRLAEEVRGCSHIWANSPNFDIVLLEDLYRRFEVKIPWSHKQLMDMRTACFMRGYSSGSKVIEPDQTRQHDAAYDAWYQANVVQKLLAS